METLKDGQLKNVGSWFYINYLFAMNERKPWKVGCLRLLGWVMVLSIPILIIFKFVIGLTVSLLVKNNPDSSLLVVKSIFDSLTFVLMLFGVLATGFGIVLLFLSKKEKKDMSKPDMTPDEQKIPYRSML